MDFFRQTNKRILLLWSVLLALMLLCAQGVKLHAHDLGHGDEHHSSDGHIHAIEATGDHGYLSKVHFAHDTSHSEHHDDVVSEIDISPDGLLKNTNNSVFAIMLFALFFILMVLISSRQLIQRCRESQLILRSCQIFSPPLRAPPQYYSF